MTTLPDQIGENPVFFALLQVCDLGCSQLGAPQAASEEDGNHGVVTLAAECRTVEHGKECPALFRGEPIANPGSMLLRTFDTADSGREVRAEQARVGCLVCQTPDGGESQVDC